MQLVLTPENCGVLLKDLIRRAGPRFVVGSPLDAFLLLLSCSFTLQVFLVWTQDGR